MIKIISLALIAATILLMSACNSNEVSPNEKLVGTWEVTKVEGRQKTIGGNGIVLTDDNPTGTINFTDKGKGKQDYSFTLFGNSYLNINDFFWTSNESEIIIDLWGDDDMIWKRIVNTDHMQVATYDIVVNEFLTVEYTLTLEQ